MKARHDPFATGLLLAVVVLAMRAFGHNGELPPAPPVPAVIDVVSRVEPARWSWLHWWEANRDPYLVAIRQRTELQPPDPAALQALKSEAAGVLRQVIERSDHVAERAAAALALGQLGAGEARVELEAMADGPGAEPDRRHALLAIGLLGGREAENYLLGFADTSMNLPHAATAGIGLLLSLGEEGAAELVQKLRSADPTLASLAAWSMRQHGTAQSGKAFRSLLVQTPSAWLASEAALALGASPDDESLRALVDLVAGGPRSMRFPACRVLNELDAIKRSIAGRAAVNRGDYDKKYQDYEKQAEQHRRFSPNYKTAPKQAQAIRTLVIGEERVLLGALRASAVIALGGHGDRPEARAALAGLIREPNDPYNALPKGLALILLGELGAKEGLAVLLDTLGPTDRRNRSAMEDPIRGHAAIALGLYARPYETPQGMADRPAFDRGLGRLAERLADPRETQEVRGACAVALGLAGRTSSLRPLQVVTPQLTGQDALIGGYILMARGMLADRNILPLAQQLLARERDATDMEGILTRRAAVLGLGLCGADEAVPLLTDAWHLNYYVNREVVLALSLHGARGVARVLIDRIKESTDADERAYLATVLGELFTAERPDRLARLSNGCNYAMRQDPRLPFQLLANEFMYGYLLPASGEAWR